MTNIVLCGSMKVKDKIIEIENIFLLNEFYEPYLDELKGWG